jgi:hypothetical protein
MTEQVILPGNYSEALRRLYSIEHKFNRDPEFAKRYIQP